MTTHGAASSITARTQMTLASLNARLGDFEEALSLFRGTLDVLETTGEPLSYGYQRMIDFAGLLRDGERHEDARWAYEKLIGLMETEASGDPSLLIRTLREYAGLERRLGRDADADRLETRAHDLEAGTQSG
jgi:hypothetical protein